MNVLKRIILAAIIAPLAFNAGYDCTRLYAKHKVMNYVADMVMAVAGVDNVQVRDCYNVKDKGWLCDVSVQTQDGDTERHLLPVPYSVIK